MSPNVVITGASSGIGLEVAKLLSRRFECLLISRRNPNIEHSIWKECDLSSRNQLENLLEYLKDTTTEVKLLVHGAGVMKSHSSLALPLDDAIDSYMINTIAPMVITSALAKKISRANGVAVAISSIASKLDIPGEAIYSSSKSALDKAFETFSSDLSRLGGTYLKIHPCMIDTPMTENLTLDQREYMHKLRSTRIQPTPMDLARFIAELADAPPWITGSSLFFGGLRR
jgi:3-oxoacyl-[acyl-carrier protein] reductase